MAVTQKSPAEVTFDQQRHAYLRVSTQGQTRLTVSTFLAGLTFAAFAALLSQPNIIETPRWGADPWHHPGQMIHDLFTTNVSDFLFAVSGSLLALTTLCFLLGAVSTYVALLRLADISPSAAKQLTEGIPPGGGVPVIDAYDVPRITHAYETYATSEYLVPLGLAVTFIAVPLFAFHVNLFVGIITTVASLAFARRLPALLRGIITPRPRRPPGSLPSP